MVFSQRKTYLIWGILLGLCYHLTQSYVTLGHPSIVSSNPAPGETLTAPPDQIVITFSDPIGANSTFVLYDGDFRIVSADVFTDASQPNLIIGRNVDIVKPGVYTVQWLVTGPDGHSIDGSFSFAVKLEPDHLVTANLDVKKDENHMELVALSESAAVNLPGWFAWMMVVIALVTPSLVLNILKKK